MTNDIIIIFQWINWLYVLSGLMGICSVIIFYECLVAEPMPEDEQWINDMNKTI